MSELTLDIMTGGLVYICTDVDGLTHRAPRAPGSDLSDLPDDVRAEIEAIWTPEVVAAWEASQAPPPPTAAHVHAERDRRLAGGFIYDFGNERGEHFFGTTTDDMKGWEEVRSGAGVIRRLGLSTLLRISTKTGAVEITPEEWDLVEFAALTFRQPIWQASFDLEAMDPIPADYADDVHWPPAA